MSTNVMAASALIRSKESGDSVESLIVVRGVMLANA